MLAKHRGTTVEAPAYPVKDRCSEVEDWQTIQPTEGVPAPIYVRLPQVRPRREQQLCTHEPSRNRDHPPGKRCLRYLKAPTGHHHAMGHHETEGARPCLPDNDAMPPAMPGRPQHRHICGCLRHHEPHPSGRGGCLGAADRRSGPTTPTPPHRGHHLWGILSRGTQDTGGHRGRRQ